MAEIRNEKYVDADRLAEDFLIVNCVWDPADKLWQDGDTVHPALERYLSRSAFEQGDFTLRYWRDTFYKWDAGRYFPVSDSDMKCWIKSFLHSVNETASTGSNYTGRYVNITAARIANIILCLAGTQGVHIPERRSLNNWVNGSRAEHAQTIAFNNGLLVTDGRGQSPALIEHTPRYFTLTKLPYDYDPQAECPRWREFLLDVMGWDVERIELLCQWAGYLLMPTTEQQKLLLIAGEGQNGKTVFTSILERMVGLDNVSHIPLSQFSNQFALVSTLGKVLNSTSESSHRLDQFAETTLKSYTSGDRMTFQRKYKEPVHDVPTAKIMISTNQLPQFSDKSNGIWRRLLYVPFEKSYPEHLQNPHLVNELSAELPGI